MLESDVTAFHFSVYADTKRPLNYTHEYQAVFVEKPDGSHVFDLQTGMLQARESKKLGWTNNLRLMMRVAALTFYRDTFQYDGVQ